MKKVRVIAEIELKPPLWSEAELADMTNDEILALIDEDFFDMFEDFKIRVERY